MNTDILKGKWNQIKGDVKKSFGKLTDDDMMVIEGDATKATGLLQERYGYTREEAEKKWNERNETYLLYEQRKCEVSEGVREGMRKA